MSSREKNKTRGKIRKLRKIRIETWKTFDLCPSYQDIHNHIEADNINETVQPLKSLSESFLTVHKLQKKIQDDIATISREKLHFYNALNICTLVTPNKGESPRGSTQELKKSIKNSTLKEPDQDSSNDNPHLSKPKDMEDCCSTFIKSINFETYKEISLHDTAKSYFEVKKTVPLVKDKNIDNITANTCRESDVALVKFATVLEVKSIENSVSTETASNEQLQPNSHVKSNIEGDTQLQSGKTSNRKSGPQLIKSNDIEDKTYLQGVSTFIKSTNYEKFEEISLPVTEKCFDEVKETIPSNIEIKIDNVKADMCRESHEAFAKYGTITGVKSAVNSVSIQTVSDKRVQNTRDLKSNLEDHLQPKQSSKKESDSYNIMSEVHKIIRTLKKTSQSTSNPKVANVIKKTHVGIDSTDVEKKNLCTNDEQNYAFMIKETNAFENARPFQDSCDIDVEEDIYGKSYKLSRDKTNESDTVDTNALVNPVSAEINKDSAVQANFKRVVLVEDMGSDPIKFHQDTKILLDIKDDNMDIDQTSDRDNITQDRHLIPTQCNQNELETEILEIAQVETNVTEDNIKDTDLSDTDSQRRTLFNVFHQYIVKPLFERGNEGTFWADDGSLADNVTIRTVSFPNQIERRDGTLRRRDPSLSTIYSEITYDHPLRSTLDVLQNRTDSIFFQSAKQKTAQEVKAKTVPKTKRLFRGPEDSWVPESGPLSKRHLQLQQRINRSINKEVMKNNEGTQTAEFKTDPPYEGEQKEQIEKFEKRTKRDGKADCYCYEKDFNLVRNHTGMFKDGRRRVDMVLVMQCFKQDYHVEFIRLNFLVGLVKAGLHLESENGVYHKDLVFIKLHATDTFLKTYGQAFGVGSPLRRYHTGFDPDDDQELAGKLKYRHEGEMLAAIRSTYKKPLRLSNYQRSYIVLMALLYISFGDKKNYFGVERLIDRNIVTDMFALHDGPYEKTSKTNYFRAGHFNGRQVLYSTWCGLGNIIWGQPLYNIYEYFGPKLGFYFTFYEYYNKMLAIASLWGIWMMLVYQTSSGDYMSAVREYTCNHINLTDSNFLSEYFKTHAYWPYSWHSVICAECEGTDKTEICPYTLVQHFCLDLKIMKVYDSPYIIPYSFGISGLVLLFLALWKRIQHFWSWMFEENELGVDKHLIKPSYSIGRSRRGLDCNEILKSMVFDSLVPILAILFPILMVFFWYVADYEDTRALSSKGVNHTLTAAKWVRIRKSVTPALDRGKEYSLLVSQTFYLAVLFYLIEKLLHFGSYYVTKWENHKTYRSFERSLILCFFLISCHYTFYPTLYHAWLKGAFYHTPISHWNLALTVITPLFTGTIPFTKMLSACWVKTLRIFLSLNCSPFSCLRHGFVVYCVLLLFRVLIVGLLDLLYRFLLTAWNIFMSCRKFKNRTWIPTVEREYMLQTFTERELVMNYNSLFLQFSLVMLFCPIMPLAPLLALLINLWDLRYKAHLFVVHYRRTILHKSSGIGSWNRILTMLCFALPFIHAITVARTDIFQKYIFNKVYSRKRIPVAIKTAHYYRVPNLPNTFNWHPYSTFVRFMYHSNYIQGNLMRTHPEFAAMNQERISLPKMRGGNGTPITNFNWMFHVYKNNQNKTMNKTQDLLNFRCRLHGYFQETRVRDKFFYYTDRVDDMRWPYAYNYMERNLSYFAPLPHHYEWYFYKTFYVLFATLFFALVAFCLYRYKSVLPSKLQRYILREQQLLRLRKLPFGLPRPEQKLTEVESTVVFEEEGIQNGINPTAGWQTEVASTEVKPAMDKLTKQNPNEINANEVKPTEVTLTGMRPAAINPNEVNPTEVALKEMSPVEINPKEATLKEMKPAAINPNEVNPTEVALKEMSPVEINPKEATLKEMKPAEINPNEINPTEVTPTGKKPAEIIPNELALTGMKPSEINHTEVKPSEVIPTGKKSAEINANAVKPTKGTLKELKPGEINATEAKPTEVTLKEMKPAEINPNDVTLTEMKSAEKYSFETKPTKVALTEMKPAEIHPNEVKRTAAPNENKPGEDKPNEARPTAGIPKENQPGAGKPTMLNPKEGKTTDPTQGASTAQKVKQTDIKRSASLDEVQATACPRVTHQNSDCCP